MIRIVTNFKEICEVLNYYAKDHEAIREGRIDLGELAKKLTAFGSVIELTEGKKRIGFAGFYHNDRKLRRAFLSMIMVMPEYREKGYGTRLLKEVEHECHEDGMRILAVQVRTDNQKGIRFFENSGFSVINALSEKKVIMEKNLQ